MANKTPEWERNKDAEEIVRKLIENYPDRLGHIDPEVIACFMITNKERPESYKWYAKMEGVKPPVSLVCPVAYVIYFFHDTWDLFNDNQKSLMLMDRLLRVPEELDGTTLQDDLKALKSIINAFGVDPYDNPRLPDLTVERENLLA